MDRERYGGGRSGGINRYPDVSGRTPPSGNRSTAGGSYDRPTERRRESGRPASSAEPWSEVPPELEELLRAQQAKSRPAAAPAVEAQASAAPKRRTASKPKPVEASTAAQAADVVDAVAEAPAPKRRTTTRKPATADAPVADAVVADPVAADAAPKKRTTRSKAADTTEG
jgi:hypothetical protein